MLASDRVPRNAPLAFFSPTSANAARCFRSRHNSSRLYASGTVTQPYKVSAIFDLAAFAGRRVLSFGSSRSAAFQLPATPSGVEKYHFLIHFDVQTGRLALTDTSRSGIFVAHTSDRLHFALLNHASVIVDRTVFIRFPGDNGLEFRLDAAASPAAFAAYTKTIYRRTCDRRDMRQPVRANRQVEEHTYRPIRSQAHQVRTARACSLDLSSTDNVDPRRLSLPVNWSELGS